MTKKIKALMDVWGQRPAVQITGDSGWDDFFQDPEKASWAARLITAMASASKDMARVNDGCITGTTGSSNADTSKPTCIYLLDGRKIVVGRDRTTKGPAWLEVLKQATIQEMATPGSADTNPNNENLPAPQPAQESNSHNPDPSPSTAGTALASGQTTGSDNRPSSAAARLAKARAAKAAKRKPASTPPEASSPASTSTPPPATTPPTADTATA